MTKLERKDNTTGQTTASELNELVQKVRSLVYRRVKTVYPNINLQDRKTLTMIDRIGDDFIQLAVDEYIRGYKEGSDATRKIYQEAMYA